MGTLIIGGIAGWSIMGAVAICVGLVSGSCVRDGVLSLLIGMLLIGLAYLRGSSEGRW